MPMNKQEWKEKMRKLKWATKNKGEKWSKKTMLAAADYIIAFSPKEEKSKENWKGAQEPTSIKEIMKGVYDGP